MDLPPIVPGAGPFFCDIFHGQIQHFQETVIGRGSVKNFGILSQRRLIPRITP